MLLRSAVTVVLMSGCATAAPSELASPPRIVAPEGAFVEPVPVRFEADAGTVLRYTLDGSEPTITSPRYDGLIRIDASCVMRVRAFEDGVVVSEAAERVFTRIDRAKSEAPHDPGESDD